MRLLTPCLDRGPRTGGMKAGAGQPVPGWDVPSRLEQIPRRRHAWTGEGDSWLGQAEGVGFGVFGAGMGSQVE